MEFAFTFIPLLLSAVGFGVPIVICVFVILAYRKIKELKEEIAVLRQAVQILSEQRCTETSAESVRQEETGRETLGQ